MEFESTTFVVSINGIEISIFIFGLLTFDFQLFGPQIRLQRPKKLPNSKFHIHYSICSVFRNCGSHFRSVIFNFIISTSNSCGQE